LISIYNATKEKKATENINEYFKQLGTEIHRRAVKKFPRRKVYSHAPNEIHSADIVDMSSFSHDNKGHQYILVIIDIYSRYGWAIPLKKKNTEDVLNAFKKHYKSIILPKKLWTDQGGEFYNAKMKAWCDKNGITLYSTFGDHKAAVVERFNRTIKEKLYRTMTQMYTDDWMTYLPDIIEMYNDKVHRSLGETPSDVYSGEILPDENDEKIQPVKNTGSKSRGSGKSVPRYSIGDKVRISRIKKTFEKGYAPSWSTAVYQVAEVLTTNPVTYKLKDRKGNILEGSFYEQELQKTKLDKLLIVKIVKKKGNRFLVQYHGYTDEFNEWLTKDDILSSDELNNKYYKPANISILR